MRRSELLALEELAWALDASGKPSLFAIFYEAVNVDELALEIGRRVTSEVVLLKPGIDIESTLRADLERRQRPVIDILSNALSQVPQAERASVNASRDRILELGTTLVLVEPAAKKAELYRDFPDLFAVARSVFNLSDSSLEDDYLFDNSPAWRLNTIAARLPPAFTRGATLIQQGRTFPKAPPQIPCPKCGQILVRGTTELIFVHAPEATRTQQVAAWVCPCGESYVPGRTAKAAHHRAFGTAQGFNIPIQ